MKKRFLSILFAIMLICTLFVGCKEEKAEPVATYTVKTYTPLYVYPASLIYRYGKNTVGDFYVTTIQVNAGDVIGNIVLKDIKEDTYRFCGWYTDEYFSDQWSLPRDKVYCDLTLYSKWEKIN